MPDTRWKGKGEALPRRSPRKGKRGKTCGRPFKAPRPVKETKKKSVKVTATETQDSQVQEIVLVTETETEDNHVQEIVTVKYIYGPATVVASQDGDIGSSIQGRIENGIPIGRLTTIIMPMKGATL